MVERTLNSFSNAKQRNRFHHGVLLWVISVEESGVNEVMKIAQMFQNGNYIRKCRNLRVYAILN
ncbi:MAG: hypothetical protein OXE92_10605, partial [Bacteroidetes bacterium]|nr:hypothetical protein [Bacteroidota bacterium]